jgi:hypothetical protein
VTGNIKMMNAYIRLRAATGFGVLMSALVASVGCTSISDWKPSKMFSMDSTWPFADKDKPHEGIPVKMVCTWSDTVMTQAGQKPQRGFGGRIMFYEKDEKKPILVDGQLVVYAFDEAGRAQTDNKPTRRYVFPAEQIPLHMSKSELGASYSFWLPWDEAGAPRAEVGLICRFEPKGGAVVTSEQAKQKLSGSEPMQVAEGAAKPPKLPDGVVSKPAARTLQSLQQQRTNQRAAQQANYEVPVSGDGQSLAATNDELLPSKRMSATTITLPNNFQMPTAAALAAQKPQSNAHAGLQPYPGQPVLQQTPVAAVAASQQTLNPAFGLSGPTVSSQLALGSTGPPITVPAMQQPLIQSPDVIHMSPITGGLPVSQQRTTTNQQATIQDLLQQQQALQQKLQQLQTATASNGAPQVTTQAGGGTTVSYPAAGTTLR